MHSCPAFAFAFVTYVLPVADPTQNLKGVNNWALAQNKNHFKKKTRNKAAEQGIEPWLGGSGEKGVN